MIEIAPGIHVPSGTERACTWRKCTFKCPAEDELSGSAIKLTIDISQRRAGFNDVIPYMGQFVGSILRPTVNLGQMSREGRLTKSEKGALDLVVGSLFGVIERLDPTALDPLGFPSRPRPQTKGG